MAAPEIKIFDEADSEEKNTWAVGTVKASTSSSEFSVHVWNNKGGTEAKSDMIECSVGVFDSNGLATEPIAAQKWVSVSVNGNEYTAIGGTTTAPVYAASAVPASFINDPAVDHVLKGTANDGNSGTQASADNYASCKFKVTVPSNAPPGSTSFKIRFQGYYV